MFLSRFFIAEVIVRRKPNLLTKWPQSLSYTCPYARRFKFLLKCSNILVPRNTRTYFYSFGSHLWSSLMHSVRRRPDITLMSKLDIAENCRNKFRKFPLTMDMNEETFSLIVLQSFPDNAWPWRPQPPSAKPLKNNPNNIQQCCMGESLSLSFP